jgi:pimeloyl-ACP methyl ester carboxylesterase
MWLDGVELEVLDLPATEAGKPCYVLLHEGLGCVALWRDFPQRLQALTGARVVAYSRRGYGQSTALPAGLRHARSVRVMHEEAQSILPKLLSALTIEQPILIGHSDGASIALIYAGTFPESVKSLCVMAPHLFVEPICVESIQQARSQFETGKLAERMAKYHRDPAATFYAWADVWLHPAFLDWNIQSFIPRITAPILAIQGEQDAYGTVAQIAGFANKLLIPNCGHSPHIDHPDAVLKRVLADLA